MSTDTTRSQRFADALTTLEQGDHEEMLAQFTDDADLLRPEQTRTGVSANTEKFWQEYSSQFTDISTEFSRIVEAGELGILEWNSSGTLANGRDISYAGVSLLTFDGDKVARFATYYDTAAFLDPTKD